MVVIAGILAELEPLMAQTWTQTGAPTNNWTSVTISADGNKIYATALDGIYRSFDAGNHWTKTVAPANYWNSIAASADGTNLIAVGGVPTSFPESVSNSIYTSDNSGTTWISNAVPQYDWTSAVCSGDGKKLVAVARDPGAVLSSTNEGITWETNNLTISFLLAAALTPDGRQLALIADAGNNMILISTNFGQTWATNATPLSVASSWRAIATSVDGKNLIAASSFGGIFQSFDSGITWTSNNVRALLWSSIASSANGSILLAADQSIGAIYSSTNGGASWISNNIPPASWTSIAVSADGCKSIAAANNGGIFIGRLSPSPRLQLKSLSQKYALSWITPSTNFVLQQSFDLAGWTTLTNLPSLNFSNLNEELSLSPTNDSGFFRLIAQ